MYNDIISICIYRYISCVAQHVKSELQKKLAVKLKNRLKFADRNINDDNPGCSNSKLSQTSPFVCQLGQNSLTNMVGLTRQTERH